MLGGYLMLFCVILLQSATSIRAQCAWEYNRTSVTCRLRILERTGLDLQDAEGSTKLDIVCNDVYLYESQWPVNNVFAKFSTLKELWIDSCKLLQLSVGTFDGLNGLKVLRVNTKNAEWSPGKSLEIYNDSLQHLKELQTLDLSDNNLRALPEAALCPLSSLQVLNLTMNRIRSADSLGFADRNCVGGSELQTLDASYNELRTIPSNWGTSGLRRLQQLYLQYNNISDLSADALAGLTSLRILNLSSNHLEVIPEGLFAASKELREIHLQNNQLFELPRGLFHRLEQLLILDLSANQLSSHHIDNATFSGLIRLIILNLAHNALTKIDSKTFKELYFLQLDVFKTTKIWL